MRHFNIKRYLLLKTRPRNIMNYLRIVYAILFKLPPVRRRPRISRFMRWIIYPEYDRRFDDAYIYYKVFVASAIINVIGLLLHFVSFIFRTDINGYVLYIKYIPSAPIDALIYGYPTSVFPILAIFIFSYSAILHLINTDYWSQGRIINEQAPQYGNNITIYNVHPIKWLLFYIFFLYCGLVSFYIIDYLRSSTMLNSIHDFGQNNAINFMLYAVIYLSIYQIFYCQMFTTLTVQFVRSVLKYVVYKPNLSIDRKEKNDQ